MAEVGTEPMSQVLYTTRPLVGYREIVMSGRETAH